MPCAPRKPGGAQADAVRETGESKVDVLNFVDLTAELAAPTQTVSNA
jgi:hypothetical protein